MTVHAGNPKSSPVPAADGDSAAPPTFALDVFAWDAPDRLELAGSFSGLREPLPGPPVLQLLGQGQGHRLPAVPDSLSGPAEDGRRWRAAFAWQEAPTAFDVARLELGGVVVELPEPQPTGEPLGDRVLPVRPAHEPAATRADEAEDQTDGAGPREGAQTSAGGERLRLQTDLLSAHEEIRELLATGRRTGDELARARQDLEADRARHAGDVERFREGLAAVRGSAEEAVAAEQAAAERLQRELEAAREAIGERDAALQRSAAELRSADTARARAESAAGAIVEGLRDRVSVLEQAVEGSESLRLELEAARLRADEAHARLLDAGREAAEGRSQAERLLERLVIVDDLLQDGR